MLTVGLVTVYVVLLVALTVGSGYAYGGMGAFALLSVAILSSWEARQQASLRTELAGTVGALRHSEATSWIQAQQQQEVASFGQLALGGADTDALQAEATRLLARTLEVDFAVILKLQPGNGEFVLVAGAGLPHEAIGRVTGAGRESSQSGYTLATGSPTVVTDWTRRTASSSPSS